MGVKAVLDDQKQQFVLGNDITIPLQYDDGQPPFVQVRDLGDALLLEP